MKKVRVVHFWIGVIVSIFLLIESTTGIIMYFDKGGDRPEFLMNSGSQQSNNQSGGENSSIQNGQSNENFQPSFQNGNPNFDNRREQSAFSVKSLHSGIIGLISGIGLFILTGTGLILSWILWRNKRKNKKRKDKVAMAI